MNKCPRCENEKLEEDQNFCQICGLKLKAELKRTAQEVPVQEQLAKIEKKIKSIQLCITLLGANFVIGLYIITTHLHPCC
ncbi:zinc ribbon domain-containing protein [uncultured Clostridium sp.]|uniref:zinc ribbon domain-containing protein n=1 Tax=uncultured Clostridium sp. TaxID=59620 RepID=UPI002730DE85|nr:zinc ribbon domain-containing protein [uncultured Clostridium sp.]